VKWEKTRVARPRRLTLQTPVRYRTKGLGRWLEGLTENLSHSGVLLHGPQQLSECTLVELILEMPEQISGQKNSMVLCQARIVRHAEVQESNSQAWQLLFSTTDSCLEVKQREVTSVSYLEMKGTSPATSWSSAGFPTILHANIRKDGAVRSIAGFAVE
jgi:hypothetical protein